MLVILGLGYIYLKTATPLYESNVLLKKNNASNSNSNLNDPYFRLIALQFQDDIATEMALVKTRNVLIKTAVALNLNLFIKKIVTADGKINEINIICLITK